MKLAWFKNPDHIVYAKVEEFCPVFGKETGIANLREKIEEFKANPTKEGVLLKGQKRTSLKLFIPNLYFAEENDPIDMGDTIWVYLGENYECYCLYWPLEEQ